MRNNIFILLQFILPHNITSRLISRIADSKNNFIKNFLIKLAVKKFKINIKEAKEEDLKKYKSFNDFFTRDLKDNIRPIKKSEKVMTSPADGILSEFGNIENGKLIQAKKKFFTLESLICKSSITKFNKFSTIYLAPKDYHKVHMPIDGKLIKMVYIPGKLFSVNEITTRKIDKIFSKNERLICYFETRIGEIAIILVGAFLVAGIETVWQGKITPNYYKESKTWNYNTNSFNITFRKGDKIAWFHYGSTVITLTSDKKLSFVSKNNKKQIKVNQDLAFIEE